MAMSSLLVEMSPKGGFSIERRQFPPVRNEIACEHRRISGDRFSGPEKKTTGNKSVFAS